MKKLLVISSLLLLFFILLFYFFVIPLLLNPPVAVAISELHVDGRWIKDKGGNIVLLRGVNQAGYIDHPNGWWNPVGGGIYSGFSVWNPDAVKVNLDNMSISWGMNVLRLHTSIEWWKTDNSSYRQHIKDTITWADERGMFVIFEPWCVGGEKTCIQDELPFPPYSNLTNIISSDQDFLDYWASVANELKSYPNIIFEFYNEPHGNQTVKEKYFEISQRLINAIRATGADQIILIQWGYDVYSNLDYPSGGDKMDWVWQYPLTDPINNLAYSTHIYRDGGFCHRSASVPSIDRNRWQYDEIRLCLNATSIDYVANTLSKPVLIGEIGANMWYNRNKTSPDQPSEFEKELAYFNNTLSILNEWKIGYVDWVWTSPAHMRHGVLQNAFYIPPPTESGQILIDKIAEGEPARLIIN